MILNIPLTIWFGILTFLSLFTTAALGYATHKGKRVFKYHRFFAVLTLLLAITHVTFVILLYVFGISV